MQPFPTKAARFPDRAQAVGESRVSPAGRPPATLAGSPMSAPDGVESRLLP